MTLRNLIQSALAFFLVASLGAMLIHARQQEIPVRFTDIAAASGITFKHENGASPQKHMPETMTGGSIILDYDNDGNNRNGTFSDVNRTSGIYRTDGKGLVLMAIAGQMASQPNGAISAALADLDNGRVLESIQQLKKILQSDPTNGSACFYLSTIYTEMKEYDVAERLVRRAMEVNSKQGPLYYQLGLIRYRQKQFRSALEFYHQALEMGSGTDAQVWRSIGDVQLELFDRDAAFQAYTEALRIQPRDARTQLALGRFYQEKGEPGSAIDHLSEAIHNDPRLRAAYPILGRAYQQSGELGSAASVLKQAVDTDPTDQESRYALGRVLIAMGRADEGREQLEKYDSVRQQVAGAEGRYQTALSRIDERKFSEGEMLLRETVELAPKYGPALHSLGRLLLDRGSPEKALPFLERAAEVTPLNADTWFDLGTAYFKTGRQAQALEAADRAVALKDDDESYQRLIRQIKAK